MVTHNRSNTHEARTPKLGDLPKRMRRGSPLASYLVERERTSRYPSWRWDLADRFVTARRRAPPVSTDPIFARVLKYRGLFEPKVPSSKLATFELKHPDLAEAFEVYEQGGLRRWVLEARLLARQSAEEIAQSEGLTVGAVTEYEAVFFNVLGRLEATFWVVGRAIGPRYAERMQAGDAGVILKAFAHFCGPRMLDHLLRVAVDRDGCLIPLDLTRLDSAEAASDAMCRFAIACLTCPADPKLFLELLGIRESIRAAKRRFSRKTDEAAPVFTDAGLAGRRYDVEIEAPAAKTDIEQAAPEADPWLVDEAAHESGEAEQDRSVA